MVGYSFIYTFRPSKQSKSEEKPDYMSPFVIFAIVLTLAYIIYYAIVISRDLAMKSGQEETNEEEIDVKSFIPTEQAEQVKSVGDGFQIGDGPIYQPEPSPEVISLDSDGNVMEAGIQNVMSSEMCRRAGESIEDMEDIEADSQPQVDEVTYAKQMQKYHGFEVNETDEEQDNTRV